MYREYLFSEAVHPSLLKCIQMRNCTVPRPTSNSHAWLPGHCDDHTPVNGINLPEMFQSTIGEVESLSNLDAGAVTQRSTALPLGGGISERRDEIIQTSQVQNEPASNCTILS